MGGRGGNPPPGIWHHEKTRYVRNGLKVYMEYEKVIHGTNVVSNKWKKYIYGKSGKIAVIESDGDMLYFIKDHLGSTRVIVDENGSVKAAFDYYPFGKLLRAWVNEDTYYRYTGQEYDAKSGYYNYNLRQYNATLGRFNSVDELKQYASGYVYVGNNPFAMTDATGLFGTDNYYNQNTSYDKNGRPLLHMDLSGMKDETTPSLMQRMLRGTSRLYTIEGAVAEQKEIRRQREEQEEKQRQIEELLEENPELLACGLESSVLQQIVMGMSDERRASFINGMQKGQIAAGIVAAGVGITIALYPAAEGAFITVGAYTLTASQAASAFTVSWITYGGYLSTRFGNAFSLYGQRAFYTMSNIYMKNIYCATDVGLSYSAGKYSSEYTPQTLAGWGIYFAGGLIPH